MAPLRAGRRLACFRSCEWEDKNFIIAEFKKTGSPGEIEPAARQA
jgi:hypothetical protein